MKKVLVLLLALSMLTFCACGNSAIDDLPEGTPDSGNVTDPSGAADPTDNGTIEWETPIDIDDAFQQEDDEIDATDAQETTPENATEPATSDPTTSQNQPTQPNATQPAPTEPAATNPVVTEPTPTEAVTKPSIGSGPIELPMIPG